MWHKTGIRKVPPMLAAVLAVAFTGSLRAEEVLHVYGPTSPFPAIQEVAVVFGDRNNVKVEVVSGPSEEWMDRAAGDADLVYSTAEFMMTAFIRNEKLQLEPTTVTPLYLRPSAILVRPDNPKNVEDFPDLLKPGVAVMVVNGSGQVGLWEDMAGKLGRIETLRALRKNIVVFAASSDEAMRLWDARPEIDAWLTWNIWHMPLRNRAKLVEVSRDYRIYRHCSIAQTQRGKAKPLAGQFVNFLTSPEGAAIFESWGWMTTTTTDSSPLTVRTDICAVCRIDSDEWRQGVGAGLSSVRQLVQDYQSLGVPASEVHVSAVFHGSAAYWLLNNRAFASHTGKTGPNPNEMIVRELLDLGVSLELCGETMREKGWNEGDILPGVKIVMNANPRIIDLELQGYAYIRF